MSIQETVATDSAPTPSAADRVGSKNSVGADRSGGQEGDAKPSTRPAPLRFVLLRGPVEGKSASSAAIFATYDDARSAFAKLGSDAARSEWAELVTVDGGRRPTVLAWSGRPFPPISSEDLLLSGNGYRQLLDG